MKIVPSNRLRKAQTIDKNRLRYSPTHNIYIWMDRNNQYYNQETEILDFLPFINKVYLREFLSKNYALGSSKQTERSSISNIKKYFDLDSKGFKHFASKLDLRNFQDITKEEIEDLLVNDVKEWYEGIGDRSQNHQFQQRQKRDAPPEELEIPDNLSSTNMDLDEIGMNLNDFEL
tara:strand:- start:10 stop:534 length:525 start_codon:yes stop_codon:yes gene_type:complete